MTSYDEAQVPCCQQTVPKMCLTVHDVLPAMQVEACLLSQCCAWQESYCFCQAAKLMVSVTALQRDPNEWVWEPIALIGFLLFFRALVYLALRKRTKALVR